MNIYFIGPRGTDAGGWYIGRDGKIHRIPGWNPEAMVELSHAINVIREAGQLKTPGLADRCHNSRIGAAAADVAFHESRYLLLAGIGIFTEEREA